MKRLVDSWVAAEKERYGNNLTAALQLLNDTLDTTTMHSRVSEWRRGRYKPSQGAISFMLYRTLPWALERSEIANSATQFQQLEDLLWESIEEEGQRSVELL